MCYSVLLTECGSLFYKITSLSSLFKTPMKCSSLSLLLCINQHLHMFRSYLRPSSGGSKTTFIPHPMLRLPLYLCSLFVCKLQSLTRSEFKTCIKYKILKNLSKFTNCFQIFCYCYCHSTLFWSRWSIIK
jgi:hypothetical protein